MSKPSNVESRLTSLERDLAELKQRIDGRTAPSWIEKVTGSFKDDPEFDEILRLGRELRKVEELDDNTHP
jgi:hypothetical protein